MSRPNAAQIRLLSFLTLAPGVEFVDFMQFEQVRPIRAGVDLFVPSLVARSLSSDMDRQDFLAIARDVSGKILFRVHLSLDIEEVDQP